MILTKASGKTVASFFTPASQKKPEKITWRILNNSLIIGRYSTDPAEKRLTEPGTRRKIAAFDFVRVNCRLVVSGRTFT